MSSIGLIALMPLSGDLDLQNAWPSTRIGLAERMEMSSFRLSPTCGENLRLPPFWLSDVAGCLSST